MEIALLSASDQVIDTSRNGESDGYLRLDHVYAEGDYVQVEFERQLLPSFFWVQVDAALVPSLLYFTQSTWHYVIPTDELAVTHPEHESIYPETAFAGKTHLIRIWKPDASEVSEERNVAFNSYDQAVHSGAYPHASANIETRHDPTFAARNAIDGYRLNDHHGKFPYQSWGINQDPTARFTLTFGRPIKLTRLAITLRADFPHDSYWTQGTLRLSDGSQMLLHFTKTDQRQMFDINKEVISELQLSDLIKADDDSPFPALIEIEAYGCELVEEIAN